MIIVNNVTDKIRKYICPWIVESEHLDYDALTEFDCYRPVIYVDSSGKAEAGVISSWRDGIVFVQYHNPNATAAATKPEDLYFGLKRLDTPEKIMAANKIYKWMKIK